MTPSLHGPPLADTSHPVPAINRTDLTGHTITVEVLTPELAKATGRNPFWVGEQAIIERRNGRLVACHGCDFLIPIERAARTYAKRGATYVAGVSTS